MIPCEAVNLHFRAGHPIGEVVEGIPCVGLKVVAKVGRSGAENEKHCIYVEMNIFPPLNI